MLIGCGRLGSVINVRLATMFDERLLARIDLATWTSQVSPAPAPARDEYTFFEGSDASPDDVLVAVIDGEPVGYIKLRRASTLAANSHVLEVDGLAVDPDRQGLGAGRALVQAAIGEARQRGARKLRLRVLGSNATAQRLYSACGFHVEGVLREEFQLEGRGVDDVLMACHLVDA